MKERPILFNGEMVRAILEGRKTQTRRIIKPEPVNIIPFIGADNNLTHEFGACYEHPTVISKHVRCPYGQLGDRLWVRETWGVVSHQFDANGDRSEYQPDRPATRIQEMPFGRGYYCGHVIYAADGSFEWAGDDDGGGDTHSAWKPSIHMPRIASRILLEIVSVRVERLQSITEADAEREGVAPAFTHPDIDWVAAQPLYKWGFHKVWHEINGAESWDLNPWVWVVEFKRVDANPGVVVPVSKGGGVCNTPS